MSRIRGVDVKVIKVQKEGCDTRRNNEIKAKTAETCNSKLDAENHQISELLQKLPKLDNIFDVHKKIGEGTFSSVYLGSLKKHAGLPDVEKRWFAIKHLVPTAHPARIEHELRCLRDIGGKDNVIGVELCLRNLDTVVFVMPYIPHRKFSEYVADMDAEEVRQYMCALLLALRHVHSFGVIHRDVKPSNFLYDRENRRYLLVDFGLAQRACAEPASASRKRPREQEECAVRVAAKRVALDLSAARGARSAAAGPAAAWPRVAVAKQNLTKAAGACACAGLGGVCGACAARPGARAPRAGTQGFRPPEVLLKSAAQGAGVDVWAAGVVLASVLTARYPLLRAADDVSALGELAYLLGTEPLRRAARDLGRRVLVSRVCRGLCLRKLAARLRGPAPPAARSRCAHCRAAAPHCLCRDPARPADEIDESRRVAGFPDAAFALLARLLEPRPAQRPSADAALQHPFLSPGKSS